MPIAEDTLRNAIAKHFPDATITLHDMAGDNDHWAATIISKQFEGLNRLAQHRLVQDAVAAYDIHALSITTKTPEE